MIRRSLRRKKSSVEKESLEKLEVKMEKTESYQTSTQDFSEIPSITELSVSPESISATTLLSKFTEFLIESSTDSSSSQKPSTSHSIFQSDLRFSTVDYVVFGIMLAMSGETLYLN